MSKYRIMISKLNNLNEDFESIYNTLNNSLSEELNKLSCVKGTVMEPLYHNLENNKNTLLLGYQKCYNWLDDYLSDLKELEESLQLFNNKLLPTPLLFNEGFIPLFDKKVLPILNLEEKKESILELGEINVGLSSKELEAILDVADSQLGVRYHTMNYGPKELGSTGFGCAMFVSYCYNQVLFNGARGDDESGEGFYGSCNDFWGNVTNDGYDPKNKGFVEVSAEEAKPGDVVCYTEGSDPYASNDACEHVALYTGNGQIVGSWGSGYSGPGVIRGDVESQADGYYGMRDVHYLHYVGEDKQKKEL